MELKVKVDGVEMSIEEAISIGNNDPGIYGFRFDENSPMWTKDHECNRIYLRIQQDYMNVMPLPQSVIDESKGKIAQNPKY